MRSNKNVRIEMMKKMKESLEAASVKNIIFYDGATELCTVPFNDLVEGEEGEWATLTFRTSTGGELLVGAVDVGGSVDSFEILGQEFDSGVPSGTDTVIIAGDVGEIGSGRDIEFTRVEWTEDTNVRLNRLRLIFK